MKCPVDDTDLVISDRQGIEIDYCPQCRGVWLDRGELDKIIERANAVLQQPPQQQYDRSPERRGYDDDNNDYHQDGHHGRHHKRESFFGDLFD